MHDAILLASAEKKNFPPDIQEGDGPEMINGCGDFFFWHKTSFCRLPAWQDDALPPDLSEQRPQFP